MADGVVRPEADVEHVAAGDVGLGKISTTEATHQGSCGHSSLSYLKIVITTLWAMLQLKMLKIKLNSEKKILY